MAGPGLGALASTLCLATGPGVGEGAGWGLEYQPRGPWAPTSAQRLLKCHPRLTKKRVELVPWSTAPTSGPKTAFFAAAMKPASGQPVSPVTAAGGGGADGEPGREAACTAEPRHFFAWGFPDSVCLVESGEEHQTWLRFPFP